MKSFLLKQPVKKFILPLFLMLLTLGGQSRAVVSFPEEDALRGTKEVLRNYTSYLNFIVKVGRAVNQKKANQLYIRYSILREKSPEKAARFLKALRYELLCKLHISGLRKDALSVNNPAMKKWVGRYLGEWIRNVDEQMLRAQVL